MDGIYNAKITYTKLGFEDHGCLIFVLTLEGGGWGVNYGNYCHGAIIQLLNTLEVDNWEDLKGTYVRAEFKDSMIKRIGHLIKDQWFDYEKYVEAVKTKNTEGENNENINQR